MDIPAVDDKERGVFPVLQQVFLRPCLNPEDLARETTDATLDLRGRSSRQVQMSGRFCTDSSTLE